MTASDTETVVLTTIDWTPAHAVGAASVGVIGGDSQRDRISAVPSAKAAARFLVQAAFRPGSGRRRGCGRDPGKRGNRNGAGIFSAGSTRSSPSRRSITSRSWRWPGTIPEMYVDPEDAWPGGTARSAPTVIYPGGPPAKYDALRQRVAYLPEPDRRRQRPARNARRRAGGHGELLRHDCFATRSGITAICSST